MMVKRPAKSYFFANFMRYAQALTGAVQDGQCPLVRIEQQGPSIRLAFYGDYYILSYNRSSGQLDDAGSRWRPRRPVMVTDLPQLATRLMPQALLLDTIHENLMNEQGIALADALDVIARNEVFEDRFALENTTEFFLDAAGIRLAQAAIRRALARFHRLVLDTETRRWLRFAPQWDCAMVNALIKHRDALQRIEREAPNLMPALLAYARQTGAAPALGPDSLRTVKQWLVQARVSRHAGLLFGNAGWRRLAALPVAYVREAVFSDTCSGLFLIRQLDRLPPLPLFRLWCRSEQTAKLPVRFLNAAVQEAWQHHRAGTLQSFLEECTLAEDWAQAETDRIRARKGVLAWNDIQREQQAWHRQMLQTRQASTLRWDSLVAECEIDGFRIVPLIDGASLWQEGQAMRHCVAAYDQRCVDGEVRVFSISSAGKRVATMEIIRLGEARWRLGQVKGFANAAVHHTILQAAEKIRQRYEEIWTLRQGTH